MNTFVLIHELSDSDMTPEIRNAVEGAYNMPKETLINIPV